jgi:KaiC/GvpD/RAD55 family RecA-like ATPase
MYGGRAAFDRVGAFDATGLHSEHSLVYDAVSDLASRDVPIDVTTVAAALEQRGHLEAAHGRRQLSRLVREVPGAMNVEAYAKAVRSYLRELRRRELASELAAVVEDAERAAEIVNELAALVAPERSLLTRALRLVPLDDYATRPQVSWFVRQLIPARGIIVIFGSPKSGKTHVAVDVTMHAAHGMHWHGHTVPRALRVAYLAGEGHAGLRVRFHAWCRAHAPERRADYVVLPQALALAARIEDVLAVLREQHADLVVVDTLNAYFGSSDENSTADMTAFVEAVRRIRDDVGAAVLVIHHTGLADATRERGSGVLRGAADVIVQVARDDAGDEHLGVQVIAARDMDAWPEALALRLVSADTVWADDEGQPITTVLVAAGDRPVALPGRTGRPLTGGQQVTVDIVLEAARAKANGSATVLLMRHEIVAEAVRRGVNRTVAYRHLEKLAPRMRWRLLDPGALEVKL